MFILFLINVLHINNNNTLNAPIHYNATTGQPYMLIFNAILPQPLLHS